MSLRIYLLVITAFTSFCVACSSAGKNNAESEGAKEIILDDGYKTNDQNEVIIDDKDFQGKYTPVKTSAASRQEKTEMTDDGSQITTMYDGFGNKTETRNFGSHNRLQLVVIRTAADGRRQVLVYGRNGEVKDLPANLFDRALSASADEIADSTGIYQSFKETYKPVITQNQPTVKPFPNYNPPIQNQPVETPDLRENQTSESIEESSTNKSEENSKQIAEKNPPDKKPDEEK